MRTQFSISTIFMAVLALFVTIGTTGCGTKGCMDMDSINYNPDATKDDGSCTYEPSMSLHLHPMFGMTDFAYNTDLSFSDGRKINFSTARFYVSGVSLSGSGSTHNFDNYLLVNPGQMMYELGSLPVDNYSELSFDVGVDSLTNHSDPSTYESSSALAPQSPNMHWNWNSGYIFVKLEGMVDSTAAGTGAANAPFELHIGMDMALRNVALTTDLNAEADGTYEVMIMTDYSRFFDNFDWSTDRISHTMDNMPTAMKLANNMPGVFMLGN